MNRFRRIATFALAAALAVAAMPATAEEPAHTTFDDPPPGTIVQSRPAYLAGEAMHSQWRGVLSKKVVGSDGTRSFYQWYLSLYAIDGTTYKLQYRSPKEPVPFAAVTQAHGARIWFPVQDASIAGAGELMGPGATQLVVASHEAAADCGTSRVDVFFYDASMKTVMTTLSVQNPCSLAVTIVKDGGGDELQMTGPYYAQGAALCCPTKPKATATFRFRNGSWTQTPRYFKILN
jgi:hypothetical protein